ncbi:MAG TPA: hypothetical protein V6D12_22025 [Candidatus Obscuribacterales bacterium]
MTRRHLYATAFSNWGITHINTWGRQKRRPKVERTTSEPYFNTFYWERWRSAELAKPYRFEIGRNKKVACFLELPKQSTFTKPKILWWEPSPERLEREEREAIARYLLEALQSFL